MKGGENMDENKVILRAHIDMREVDECTKKRSG